MPIDTKRAYDKLGGGDGVRILVDGLWPRGLTKAKLKVARWMREIAPAASLRAWYGHQPERWKDFRRRYRQELAKPPRRGLVEELIELAGKKKLTLVFAARDAERSNAAVIAELIRERLSRRCAKPM